MRKEDRRPNSSSSQNLSSSDYVTTVIRNEKTPDNSYSDNLRRSKVLTKSNRKLTLQRTQNFAIEPDESNDESEHFRRKSVDIVVDVHCENDASEKKTIERNRNKGDNSNIGKGSKTNVYNLKKDGLKDVNSQDSLDLIEEIKDSPRNSSILGIGKSKGREQCFISEEKKGKSWMQETEPTSGEISGRRRRWKKVEDSDNLVDDITKVGRKRWTKNKSEYEEKIDDSLSSNYMESRPVPAPRRSSELTGRDTNRRIMEFENEAFSPDNEEEILTIETNYYKQDTKIEMSLTTMDKARDKQCNDFHAKQQILRNDYKEDSNLSDNISEHSVEYVRPSSGFEKRNNFMFDNEDNRILKRTSRSKSMDELTIRRGRHNEKRRTSSPDTTVSSFSDNENKSSSRKILKSRKTKKHKRIHRPKSDKESSRRSRTSLSERIEKPRSAERSQRKETREKKKKKKTESLKFISIKVHRSDTLETDFVTRHPMVKIHIINSSTGEYLENDGNSNLELPYLQPIITGTFDFKEHKSMTPFWEEEVIFEHDFRDLFRPEPDNVIIIFEIIDLLTFNEASHNYDKYGSESCWHKIAWAFLKPLGTNGVLHINKKLRLQLYRPQKALKYCEKSKCEAYEWWKSKIRKFYPSTLYVTVSSVEQPKLEPVFYDQLTFNEFSDFRSDSQVLYNKTSESESIPTWTRSPNETCKIPNDILFETEVSENGCFYLVFSNHGKYLAYVASEENNFPIFVYKVEEGRIHVRFNGHKYFVYSLSWSHDDRFLLSVSSDQTARIWDIKEKIIQYIHLLPHPSYVYCGKFDIETSSIVATGCYDKIIRIWTKNKRSKKYELVQELDSHLAFINSMCFLDDNTLLTGDSIGTIISWRVQKRGKKTFKKEWKVLDTIKIKEIEGIIINSIFPHPKENKILIHSRKNSLMLFNLTSGEIQQKYIGLENERIQISSCISPCGSLVLCGGEDSTLNIWNLESGTYLAKYIIHESTSISITCVSFHNFEHILAFSTFQTPSPVKVLKFEKHSKGKLVGLISFADGENSNVRINISHTESSSRSTKERSMSKMNSGFILDDQLNYPGSTNNLLEDKDNQKSLVMKLQKFIETIPVPQFGNSSKMNSIIEKIDRILSNASSSRSADDIESGRRPESSLKLDLKSTTSDFSGETVRMKDFNSVRRPRKSRPKSAKSVKSSCYSRRLEDMRNILSEGSLNGRGSLDALIDDEEFILNPRRLNVTESIATSLYLDIDACSMSDDKIHANFKKIESKDDNLDSDGTYIIEKGDIEKNEDIGSSGDSSIKSNATFTIENEVPVPKPRKRRSEK